MVLSGKEEQLHVQDVPNVENVMDGTAVGGDVAAAAVVASHIAAQHPLPSGRAASWQHLQLAASKSLSISRSARSLHHVGFGMDHRGAFHRHHLHNTHSAHVGGRHLRALHDSVPDDDSASQVSQVGLGWATPSSMWSHEHVESCPSSDTCSMDGAKWLLEEHVDHVGDPGARADERMSGAVFNFASLPAV